MIATYLTTIDRARPSTCGTSIGRLGGTVAYESTAEPIKLGYLFDFVLPDGYPAEMRADLTQPFELVFEEGLEQGIIDRPVEIVFREVEGLPKGTVKAVIDAYGELVDEGCLAVFGPSITDNCVPTKEAIEERFHVPAISVTGIEDWLGEWTFSLSMGSMTDEPIFWAHLLAKRGLDDVGVLVEQSLVGETLHQVLPRGLPRQGHPHRRRGADRPDRAGHQRRGAQAARGQGAGASCTAASGSASCSIEPGARGARLGPAAVHGHVVPERVDQPDRVERDPRLDRPRPVRRRATTSARTSSTSTRPRYGRRPEYCVPVVNRDLATVLLRAFADARPLSPLGCQGGAGAGEDAPRRVGCARAPGSPSASTRTAAGWAPGYLVARQLDPDGTTAHLVERFGQD